MLGGADGRANREIVLPPFLPKIISFIIFDNNIESLPVKNMLSTIRE